MSAVAIVLFTLGMVLIYLGYGVPIWAPLLLCCLPWVWYWFTLDTVFLYERCCYCVVYLGYGIDLSWIRCSYMSAVAIVLFTLGMVLFTLDTVFQHLRANACSESLGWPSPGARALIYWRVGCPQRLIVIKKLASAAKMSSRPKTGSRSRLSGRSSSMPHGKSLDQNSTSPRRTRSVKLTCSFCRMTAWGGRPFAMLSRSLTSAAATRRLSLTSKTAAEVADALSRIYRRGPLKWHKLLQVYSGREFMGAVSQVLRNMEFLFDMGVLISIGTRAL